MTPGSPGLFGGLALRGAGLALPGLPILAPRRPSRFEGGGDTVMPEISAEATSAAPVRDTATAPVTARVNAPVTAAPLSMATPTRPASLPQAPDRVVPDRPHDEAAFPLSLPIAHSPQPITVTPAADPLRPVADAAISPPPGEPVIDAVAQPPAMSVAAPATSVAALDAVPASQPPASGAPPLIPSAPPPSPVTIPRESSPPPVSVTISRLEIIFDAPPAVAPAPRPPAPNRARGFQAYARARSGMPR